MTRPNPHPEPAVAGPVSRPQRRGAITIALLVSALAALPMLNRVNAVSGLSGPANAPDTSTPLLALCERDLGGRQDHDRGAQRHRMAPIQCWRHFYRNLPHMAKTVPLIDAVSPLAAPQARAMPPTFSLPAELTIDTVGELYPQCRVWMHAQVRSDLCVQARDVTQVDAAGVQLLLSWARTLAADQRRLQLVGPSGVLVTVCTALGATGLIRQDGPAREKGCP